MVKFGLYVRLEAKPGKEKELEGFLQGAKSLVQAEPDTVAWFAIKLSPSVFGIFDVFEEESGREAHLNGEVAKQLMAKASELLAKEPEIHKIEIPAVKLPEIAGEKKVA